MGILTALLWIVVVVVSATVVGWVFKTVLMAVGSERIRRALRRAPITACFGMAVILVYCIVAIFAPVLAPFG